MDEFEKYCEEQEKQLDSIIEAAEQTIEESPTGKLNISYSNNSVQYYWKTEEKQEKQIKYIRHTDMPLVEALAQKDYAIKMLQLAKGNKLQLERLKKNYKFTGLTQFYEDLSPHRKKLVTPYILPEEEYVEQWYVEQYESINKYSSDKYKIDEGIGIMTEKGELVRSKSEKIIADMFHKMKVPYVYERPLYLKGYGIVRPDFIVLNRQTRQEFYWEHMGMMEVAEYAEKAVQKIETYEKNQIHVGKNLLITYETLKHTLNIKVLEEIIRAHLL